MREAYQNSTMEGSPLSFQLPLRFLQNFGCKTKKTPVLEYPTLAGTDRQKTTSSDDDSYD